MALSSQMPRNNEAGRSRVGSMYHKRKTSRAPIVIGAVVAVTAIGAWWFLKPSSPTAVVGATLDDDRRTDAALVANADQPVGSAAPMLRSPTNQPTNPANEPAAQTASQPRTVIEMGAKPVTETQSAALPDPEPALPSNVAAAPASTTSPAPANTPQQPTVQAQGPIAQMIADAARQESGGRPVEARAALNRALHDSRATEAEREAIRDRMGRLNDLLLFSSTPVAGEPFTTSATVQAGDTLVRITANNNLQTDWRFVMRVNNIAAPNRLAVGQKLKLVKGPFHAIVSKSAFRLDLYVGEPDASGNRMFVRSFPVGLGEFGSTPIASFHVRPNSKLINPSWRNPRTGEFFTADDPKNPLGEYWIGLDPADQSSAQYVDYGLHGTIDPGSIGYEKSMGCIRLAEPDIRLLYEVLVEKASTVKIVP